MRRGIRLCFACGLAILGGLFACSRRHDTTAPPPPPPPEIEGFFPPSRSTSVFYDTEIWAQFREALDPATVSARSVFLKLDTQRLACTVSYEAATRRIHVVPTVPLRLRRTYTVELGTTITTESGTPLSTGTFWQFTTIAVRVPGEPFPENGALDESPSATLLWTGTESGVGAIEYDVYVAFDSASVASRTVVPEHEVWGARRLANPRWPFTTTVYWAVTAHNVDTGESAEGPVWRFRTLPDGVPIDSLLVPALHWAWIDHRTSAIRCFITPMSIGPTFFTTVRWNLESLPSAWKLAGARVQIGTGNQANPGSRGVRILPTTADWTACQLTFGGPPFADPDLGVLANATIVTVNNLPAFYRLESDGLTSHIEASIRHHRLSGYILAATIDSSVPGPIGGGLTTMTVYYYVLPEPARTRRSAVRSPAEGLVHSGGFTR